MRGGLGSEGCTLPKRQVQSEGRERTTARTGVKAVRTGVKAARAGKTRRMCGEGAPHVREGSAARAAI